MNILINLIVLSILTYGKCSEGNFIEDKVLLTIDQGVLFGEKSLNYGKEPFYSFIGIPYAKPPIGELRFKAPQLPEPWKGVYDATQVRPMCAQIITDENYNAILDIKSLKSNEDCLFLNVHSKMSNELKPVMVWIHGGSLEYGSIFEDNYGPEFLLTEDIVLVKIAYRLNAFGFLSIDDPKYDIPGNAGFKDQVMALKWVQKNIHHFGGDPNQVTIFGESAGGASVHLLTLSPLSKGLFHRAIAQSGAADSPWLESPNKYPELAQTLKCNTENLDEIVKCINNATTVDILKAYITLMYLEESNKKRRNGEFRVMNSLIIEKPHPNSFMTDKPENIIRSGDFNKVPIILGFTTHEGEIAVNINNIKPDVTDYRTLIPRDVNIDLESEKAFELGNKIKEFYYGNQKPSYDVMDPYIDFLTDTLVLEKIYRFAKLQSSLVKDVPVYFYQFDYFTKLNMRYQTTSTKPIVTHFDDIKYLFYGKQTPENLDRNSKEYIAIHRMIKLWTTFAKNGDPNVLDDPLLNVKWLPVQTNKFNYLHITDDLQLKQNPIEKRMAFWEEIYSDTYESNESFCKAKDGNCS